MKKISLSVLMSNELVAAEQRRTPPDFEVLEK